MTLQTDYELVAKLATTDEAGGLAKERSVLLLWFLRNIVGLDDLDAYEFVCDGDADGGIDGLRLEPSTGDEDHETLVIYQSKYTEKPNQVGPASLDALPGRADRFKSADALKEFLAEGVEEKLEALIKNLRWLRSLKKGHSQVADCASNLSWSQQGSSIVPQITRWTRLMLRTGLVTSPSMT